MDSPLGVIAQMVAMLIQSGLNTLGALGELFVKFLASVGFVAATGTTGFLVSVGILSVVLFFVWKFVLKSAKEILLLLIIGAAILAALFLA